MAKDPYLPDEYFARNLPGSKSVNPKLKAGIKRANTSTRIHNADPGLAAAIKRANNSPLSFKPGLSSDYIKEQQRSETARNVINALNSLKPYKPAGLSPEKIRDEAVAEAYRLGDKIKSAVAGLGSGGGGSGGGGGGSNKGGSSSGTGGGIATPAAPDLTELINNLYAELQKEIDTQTTGTLGDYDATKQTITDQYKRAQQDLYAKYQATQNPLAAQAANLGVDYGNSSINATQDAALKRLQETGDLSLASDQAYLDKMRLMEQSKFGALKTGATQSQADAQMAYQMYLQQLAAAKAGGGGGGGSGGRRGGGGGGSGSKAGQGTLTGSVTDWARDSYEWEIDPEEYNYIQEVKKTNPALGRQLEQDLFSNTYGDVGKAVIGRVNAPDVHVPQFKNTIKRFTPPKQVADVVIAGIKKATAVAKNRSIAADRKLAEATMTERFNRSLNNPKKKTQASTTGTQKRADPKSYFSLT